jgi:hypothetical protein
VPQLFNKPLSLAAVVLVMLWQPARAIDPSRAWHTLETPHFRIHFHDGIENVARRAAAIAERVHAELARQYDWRPDHRTEVVITDDFDLPNGFASTIPYNRMVLFVVPPEPGQMLEADSHDQWLEDLIVHEYTHVLHLDRAAGWPLALRRVIGRNFYTFPNALQPLWLIEGLATHEETDHERGVGRGHGSAFAMILRTELAAGLRSVNQVSVPNVSWPAGIVPYAYGVYFYHFLTSEYGDDAPMRFVDAYSHNLVPHRMDATAREVFGRDLGALWQEFERYLGDRFGEELRALRAGDIETGSPLTEGGFAGLQQGGNLHALPDGTVYFVRDDGRRRSTLMRRNPDGALTPVAPLNHGARVRVHPRAGIVVAQPEICGEYRTRYDLFRLRPGAQRLERITHCSRYRDVAWHPDGERLAAVRFEAGESWLDLLTADGRVLETLAGGGSALLAQPDWSPDGTRLVVVRTAHGAGGDLFEFTPDTGVWRRLTLDRNVPSHPRYTPDGAAVLFTSDHGGVFNVRRVMLDDGVVETLTHTDAGAFQPHQAVTDGPVYFLHYGALGYDLHVLDAPVGRPTPPPRVVADPRPDVEPWADGSVGPYSPWPTLGPRSWLPVVRLDNGQREVGFWTFGRDALARHHWYAEPVVDLDRGELIGSVSYQWRDRVGVWLSRRHVRFANGELIRRNDTASVTWRFPVTRYDRAWAVVLGGSMDHEYDHVRPPDGTGFVDWRDDVIGVSLTYRDSLWPRLSVTEQEGRRVRLTAERSVGDSGFDGPVYVLDWREYRPLVGNHVLAARYAIGWGVDDPRPFLLGGADGSDATFNRRHFALRGYETGAAPLIGRRMELATLEYRFPIALVERGVLFPPVGLHWVSGTVFAEAGRAWDDARPSRWHPSAGAELVLDLTGGGWMGVRARLGYAHGFDGDAGGGNQFYLSLGTTF